MVRKNVRPNPSPTPFDLLEDKTRGFYLRALNLLDTVGVRYAIGGAYALGYFAGIVRHTKDLDVFLRKEDVKRVLEFFEKAGYRTARTHPHWIAKVFSPDGEDYIDLIYGSGNGMTEVDDEWLEHSVGGEVLGRAVNVCPAEEMIWSKSFIQERDRFDGADVAHLLLAQLEKLDWERLLRRFRGHEPVLLSHLILFGYVYPSERDQIPQRVMEALLALARKAPLPRNRICRGTLLSYKQYLVDIQERGHADARLSPHGKMTAAQIERWTKAPK